MRWLTPSPGRGAIGIVPGLATCGQLGATVSCGARTWIQPGKPMTTTTMIVINQRWKSRSSCVAVWSVARLTMPSTVPRNRSRASRSSASAAARSARSATASSTSRSSLDTTAPTLARMAASSGTASFGAACGKPCSTARPAIVRAAMSATDQAYLASRSRSASRRGASSRASNSRCACSNARTEGRVAGSMGRVMRAICSSRRAVSRAWVSSEWATAAAFA